MPEPTRENRLVVVSNRLPVIVTPQEGGEWKVEPGAGGLITALAPVLRNRGGLWIGWPGIVQEQSMGLSEVLKQVQRDAGYDLEPVLQI